jgi:hypothetical protein
VLGGALLTYAAGPDRGGVAAFVLRVVLADAPRLIGHRWPDGVMRFLTEAPTRAGDAQSAAAAWQIADGAQLRRLRPAVTVSRRLRGVREGPGRALL